MNSCDLSASGQPTEGLAPAGDHRDARGDETEGNAEPLAEMDYILLAYDGILAAGGADSESPSAALPPAVAQQLLGAEYCLKLLEQLWPRAPLRRSPAVRENAEDGPVQFGNYELLEELARGGMGVVYRARQIGLNRIVALKMILAGRLATEAEVKRFQNEAAAAATLDHPGIVPIYEVGIADGRHYFSMAFVDGASLQERLQQGPLPVREAADLVRQIALSVEYAHSRGIMHRDLKPHNVLVDAAGQVRLTDFGLAKRTDSADGLTQSGAVLGTPSYMAPEQAAGRIHDLGPPVDIYACGAILYAALTGHPPFQAATLSATLRQVIEQEPVPPSQANPAVPCDLETICLKCLQKSPLQRYASATALAEDLSRYARGEPIVARPVSRAERVWRWTRRNPKTAALVGLSTLVCLLLGAGLEFRSRSRQWQRTAEFQSRLASEQSKVAHQQMQLAQRNLELANLETATRQLTRAGELSSTRQPGWSWKALDELQSASRLADPQLDEVLLRSRMAACRLANDVREAGMIAEGVVVLGLAFSHDGRTLAVGESRGHLSASVHFYDVASRESRGRRTIQIAAQNMAMLWNRVATGEGTTRFQEGFTALAYSPDGRWLAGGTRQGKIHLWELSTPAEPVVLDAFPKQHLEHLQFSADSHTLYATCNYGDTLRSWMLDEGWRPAGDWQGVRPGFSLHPAGRDISVIFSWYRVLDALTHRYRTDVSPLEDDISDVTHAADGRWVIGTRLDGLVALEARTGRRMFAIREPDDEPGVQLEGAAAVIPSRGLACVATSSDAVRLYDLTSGRHVTSLSSRGPSYARFAVSPDGQWLAIAQDRGVMLYEVRPPDADQVAVYAVDAIHDVAVTDDGRHVAYLSTRFSGEMLVGVEYGTAALDGSGPPSFHLSRGHHPRLRYRVAHRPTLTHLAGDERGQRLAIGCELLGLHWSRPGQPPRWPRQLQPDGVVTQVVEQDDIQRVDGTAPLHLVSDSAAYDGRALRWDVNSATPEMRLRVSLPAAGRGAESLAVLLRVRCRSEHDSAPALRLGLAGQELTEREHLADDTYQWLHAGFVTDLQAQRTAELVVQPRPDCVSQMFLDEVLLLPDDHEVDQHSLAYRYWGPMALSSDGTKCCAIVRGSRLAMWNTDSGDLLHYSDHASTTYFTGNGQLTCLAWGGRRLAVGCGGGQVLIWETSEALAGPQVRVGPGGEVSAVALSRDGRWLAVGSRTGAMQLVDLVTGAPVAEMIGHARPITALVFEPSGQRLWSGGRDGAVRRWDRTSAGWQVTLVLTEGDLPVRTLRLAAQAQRLAVLRENQPVVHCWNLGVLSAD
ncbi:MAG: serine/threonine-protein kinase [Pirellulales bacterium]